MQDPEMRQHRVLASAMELKAENRKSTHHIELGAEVDSNATAAAMALFKRKKEQDDDEDLLDKPKKQLKLSLDVQRNKKVKCDLDQGTLLLTQLKSSELRHTSELCTNLEKNLGRLKQSYCDFAAASLGPEEATETLWKEAVAPLSKEVSVDITDGLKRLNPNAKAYCTPYDAVLS